ncbi:hypothetical protein BDU57DRAFT_513992 [Ampelomyces quisqualis]|uniref:Uncharacterized protein n=1 Tax=Ampelomyces quisqualis TaxID=50730 RepID=A0A6A5QRZ3_AMPQU|nr:hypothetical protein BDU57DRAFT_513992 [Ampelomyces quisqualis]
MTPNEQKLPTNANTSGFYANPSTESYNSMHSSVHDLDLDVSESEDSDFALNYRPRLPYTKGFKFTVTRHEPPEPYGHGYDTKPPQRHSNWKSMSLVECCLSEPTINGQSSVGHTQTLTITGIIRTGYDRGAQLVEVNNTMVAKIYDPLYYNEFNDFGHRENVVDNAEGDYSREAIAYETLQQSSAARSVTPAYFGTWITEIETVVGKPSVSRKQIREVPLILIERLYGECMSWISPRLLRKRVRSLILKKVLCAEAVIYQAGVNHCDLSPRNIMVLGSNYEGPSVAITDIQLEVRVIDFNIAEVLRHPHYYNKYFDPASLDQWKLHLPSPIVRFHGCLNEFIPGWCSDDEDADKKWLWKHFHKDPRFAPVEYSKQGRPIHRASTIGSESGASIGSGREKTDTISKKY